MADLVTTLVKEPVSSTENRHICWSSMRLLLYIRASSNQAKQNMEKRSKCSAGHGKQTDDEVCPQGQHSQIQAPYDSSNSLKTVRFFCCLHSSSPNCVKWGWISPVLSEKCWPSRVKLHKFVRQLTVYIWKVVWFFFCRRDLLKDRRFCASAFFCSRCALRGKAKG